MSVTRMGRTSLGTQFRGESEMNTYQCRVCKRIVNSWEGAREHECRENETPVYCVCPKCGLGHSALVDNQTVKDFISMNTGRFSDVMLGKMADLLRDSLNKGGE